MRRNSQLIAPDVYQQDVLSNFQSLETEKKPASQIQSQFLSVNTDVSALFENPEFDFSLYLESYNQPNVLSYSW